MQKRLAWKPALHASGSGRTKRGEVQGHQNFVGIGAVVFQGAGFETVSGEAEGLVEADGGLVGAEHGEVDLLNASSSDIEDGLHESARSTGAAGFWSDVHGAEPALMCVFAAGVDAESCDTSELRFLKCAEDGGIGEPAEIFL